MTLEDLKLEFTDHMGISRASLELPNGYGISVVHGEYTYSDENTFEVGILHNGKLCYDTPITNDVLGYQTPEDIVNIINQLEKMA